MQNQGFSMIWHPFATSTPMKQPSRDVDNHKFLKEKLMKPADVVKVYFNNGLSSSTEPLNLNNRNTKRNNRSKLTKFIFDDENSSDDEYNKNFKPAGLKISCTSDKKFKSVLGLKLNESKNKVRVFEINKDNISSCTGSLKKNTFSKKLGNKNKRSKVLSKSKTKSFKMKQSLSCEKELNGSQKTLTLLKSKMTTKNKSFSNSNTVQNLETKNVNEINKNNPSEISQLKENENNNNEEAHCSQLSLKQIPTENLVFKENKRQKNLESEDVEFEMPKFFSICEKKKNISHQLFSDSREQEHINSLNFCEKKKNISHQLFSDSREQEHINSLDLREIEVDEQLFSTLKLVNNSQKKQALKSPKIKHKLNSKISKVKENKERPTRERKGPKQYWLLPDTPQCKKPVKQRKKQIPNDKINHKSESSPESEANESSIKDKDNCVNCDKKNINNLTKNLIETQNTEKHLVLNSDKKKKINLKVRNKNNTSNNVSTRITRSKSHKKITNEKVTKSSTSAESKIDQEKIASKHVSADFFMKISQAQFFNNSSPGCISSAGWSLNGFKCGLFKIKKNSQFCSKTTHKNSFFGGVLVKGNITMKVENNEEKLEEGDMAFVPPMTEWCMINESVKESVFYYWCSRIKA